MTPYFWEVGGLAGVMICILPSRNNLQVCIRECTGLFSLWLILLIWGYDGFTQGKTFSSFWFYLYLKWRRQLLFFTLVDDVTLFHASFIPLPLSFVRPCLSDTINSSRPRVLGSFRFSKNHFPRKVKLLTTHTAVDT